LVKLDSFYFFFMSKFPKIEEREAIKFCVKYKIKKNIEMFEILKSVNSEEC
jgi:hypothetical protein